MRNALPLAVIAALALAAPAAAASPPPVQTTFSYDVTTVFAGACGGDTIEQSFAVTVRRTVYSDAAGPVRYHDWREYTGTVTNTATGVSLPARGVRIISEHLRTGMWKVTGPGIHVVAPGSGTLLLDAGQVLEDADFNVLRETGRRTGPITSRLCAALAG